ncbi:gluconate 2-dehydrogenase subunit 3 family protein [Robiginitalea sp. M366]|uniref:gluconate 2-dehydrogenase subunit 3 family protein n=1 Tax=Robiginitalea aestuariiviva TaxID=3036903 RepID=UPI00240D8898|nr:gluconate 2-dehydrogenase subunit 3 family protein [Robiginitalea aestuariiviva]MDG1571329.1 gluconate 2-dehydrogenase subunit 3 family protein [Robiginitalea aestuariiviva]
MERRKALKHMGWAMGITVATPTALSLLQSCQQNADTAWIPVFFTEAQGGALIQLVDLIIPKTDTPSASEVQVHSFIDSYMKEVPEKPEQDLMTMAFTAFLNKALKDSGKTEISDLAAEDLEPVLAQSLAQRSEEEEAAAMESLGAYMQAVQEGQPAILDEAVARSMFAGNLRSTVIWAYKTSEFVGEQVLTYLPVPGEYIGCGDLDQLTGGKAWSI